MAETKEDVCKRLGLESFDYALPQWWVDRVYQLTGIYPAPFFVWDYSPENYDCPKALCREGEQLLLFYNLIEKHDHMLHTCMEKGLSIHPDMSDFFGYNSKPNLLLWAVRALSNSTGLNTKKINKLMETAVNVIEDGGFRGDISTAWLQELKYSWQTIKNIPDLYL